MSMNMNFLQSGKNTPYGIIPNSNTQNVSMPNMFSRRRTIQFIPNTSVIPNPPQVVPIEPLKPTMLWGASIWFLFHTLAEKVRPEDFNAIRGELLNNIYAIATHLPCPICSEHAKEYFGKINFNSIQTKYDLKQLLWQFHNEVNNRKGFSYFSKDELDSKYSQANTVKIIQNFMIHFRDKNRSPKLIADDLQRMRIADLLQVWFQKNITYFL